MKVCITSQGDNLDSEVDPRFGRCQYFVIVDTESLDFEAIKNPYMDSMGGSGIQAGQFILENKATVALTGNVGPNAFRTLNAAGIKVVTGVSGKISSAVESYKKEELKTTDGPSVDSHFGTGK